MSIRVKGREFLGTAPAQTSSIEDCLEQFHSTLSRLDFEREADRDTALADLADAVAAILSGTPLTSVIRDYNASLHDLLSGQPESAEFAFAEAAPVVEPATTEVPGAPRRTLETERVPGWMTSNPIVRALLETNSVGIYITDQDGTVIGSNPRMLDILGLPSERVVGRQGPSLLRYRSDVSDQGHERLAGRDVGFTPRVVLETAVERPDGSTVWIAGESLGVTGVGDEGRYYLIFVEDITARKSLMRMQRSSEERFQALVQNLSDIIGVVSECGQLDYVTDSIERVLGYDPTSLVGQNVLKIVAGETQTLLQDVFESVLAGPRLHAHSTARMIHADGSWRWMELEFTNLMDVPGIGGVVVTARDVTKRKSFEQQLERLAYTDMLTALPNRLHFRERLDKAMAGFDCGGEPVAVVFLDLDRFKMINDRFGHDGGDSALVAVAQRILDIVRPGELVGRLGGDEFAVLIEQATPAKAMRTAHRVLAAIAKGVPEHNRFVNLMATAGVAVSSPLLNGPTELLRAADIALYKGKRAGGGVATMFRTEMYDEALARVELERDLRLALDRQEMDPWFLPEFDLTTGALCGFEALMRWRRPNADPMTPDVFLDVAIELGIIVPLGLQVLRAACEHLVEWSTVFPQCGGISITFNVSNREIAQPGFPDRIAEILHETGLDPSRLGIEIDDRVFRNQSPELIRFVMSIIELGAHLVIDNFGGWYAAWGQFRRFHVHGVKLTPDAIASEDDVETNATILRAVTTLASESGIVVSGTGLETSGLVDRARDIGCGRGQGYHLSPPLPAEGVPALLAQLPAR